MLKVQLVPDRNINYVLLPPISLLLLSPHVIVFKLILVINSAGYIFYICLFIK